MSESKRTGVRAEREKGARDIVLSAFIKMAFGNQINYGGAM